MTMVYTKSVKGKDMKQLYFISDIFFVANNLVCKKPQANSPHCFIWNAQSLTTTNVKGLMGNHLQDLKAFENDTVIRTWLNTRSQSDLDTLGLGLTTNKTDPTTAPPNSNNNNTNTSTSAATSTVTTPQGKNTYLLCVLSDSRFYAHTLACCIYSNSKLLALSGMGLPD